MRVIAGQYGGARLFAPKDRLIRPTSDRVREYIFSCIQYEVQQKRVADLFAGTGAIGIESISRGADNVTFVEASKQAADLLERNLEKLGIIATIYRRTVESFLKYSTEIAPFDFVFCDPPYKYDHFENIMTLIEEQNLLCSGGQIVYESDSRRDAPKHDNFTIIRQKKMGETQITFYRNENVKNSDLPGHF